MYLSLDKKSEKLKFVIYQLYLERPDLPLPMPFSILDHFIYEEYNMLLE